MKKKDLQKSCGSEQIHRPAAYIAVYSRFSIIPDIPILLLVPAGNDKLRRDTSAGVRRADAAGGLLRPV